MTAVALILEPPLQVDAEQTDIEIIGDLDGYTSARIVCGCNDDNPYR
jgi:hypothetical protein